MAMRAAVPGLADLLNQSMPTDITWKPQPFTPVHLAVPGAVPSTGLGCIDAVSAGAINHAALYTLLRVPGFDAELRTIDRDGLGRSNSNRYALARAADLGRAKVAQLEDFATDAIRITGDRVRLDEDTLTVIGELAPRVLVGVDDIPTRWFVQRQLPGWLGVRGTSHGFVVVSDHLPGHPCAGCVHPIDDDNPLEEIPTIGLSPCGPGCSLPRRCSSRTPPPAAALGASRRTRWGRTGQTPSGRCPRQQTPVARFAAAAASRRDDDSGCG